MFQTSGMTMGQLIWRINAEGDYFDACRRCEILVRLLEPAHIELIMRYLRYDKRKDGARGRALTHDVLVNGTELKLNDRLEPSETLPDIGAVEHIEDFPCTIIFWRAAQETMTRHRNPIFDREIGVTPARTLTIDVLHAFFLGLLNVWARISIWKLILSGAYGSLGTSYENTRAAVLILRDCLMTFYRRYHVEHASETLTRVADLTEKMLGTSSDQKLKTKGAETWGVALFLIEELDKRRALLGADGDRLFQAGSMLETIVRSWKSHEWVMPRSEAEKNLRCMSIHMELMRPFDAFIPKHHVIFHPLLETMDKGNPWYYGSWLDESLNKILKAACKNASQMTFEETVLSKMVELLKEGRGTKRSQT
jgi:hypothetical protein